MAAASGLPLLNMSPRKVISILGGAFSHLRPGAVFYQFTYGMRCLVPRQCGQPALTPAVTAPPQPE